MAPSEKDFSATAIQDKLMLDGLDDDEDISPVPRDNGKGRKSTLAGEGGQAGEETAENFKEIKKQMMDEQRENQQSVTGHDFGNTSFKLVGVHILEMYNPLKKFYAQ